MIYFYFALGLVAIAGLTVQIVGARLPVQHAVSRELDLPASPEAVWQLLTDVEGHRRWRKELLSVEMTGDAPLSWVETSKFGKLPLNTETWDPPRRWVTRIDGAGLPFGGTWTYALEPTREGTRLTLTENGEVYPPAFRFLSKYVFGHAKTIESFLAQLATCMAKGNC